MKKDWQSSTVWGAIIMALALVVKMIWGVDINDQTQAAMTNDVVTVISAVMGLIGGVTTVIGRAKATGPAELSLFKILQYIPGVLGAISKAKSAVSAVILAVAVGLLLTAPAAWAGDGAVSSGSDLLSLSLWPAAINLMYVLGATVIVLLFYRLVLDPLLILPGRDTMELISQDSRAVAVFAGLVCLGLFVMVGMVLG